jgi:polar amino acid transport system substrate-binding protein
MRKILCVILSLVLILSGCAYAENDNKNEPIEIGFLTRLRTSETEFFRLMLSSWATKGWAIFGGDHSVDSARFYDSLTLMQMALSKGEIEEMVLPDFVAEYLLKVNKNYEPCCISNSGTMSLCFGFMGDNRELAQKWDNALKSMRDDLTLIALANKYVKNFPQNNNPYEYIYGNDSRKKNNDAVKFERFKGAPTIRVAITGDLPPIDYIAEDGMPAGYNAAVLAEIGRRLKVNITTVNVSTGARTAALVSGRVDVVFWYEVDHSLESQLDSNEDIILSSPYYEWNVFMHLRNADDE